MKKNLIYFIYFNGEKNKYLEANLRLISRYLPIFNGQIIIKVAVDDLNQDLTIIKNLLPKNTTFQVVKNDPENGESPHFIHSVKQLSTKEDSITFYGHAKGVSREGSEFEFSINHWVTSLYFFNLEENYRNEAISFLHKSDKMFSGCFQKICKTETVKSDWHYSGTFFWFNTKNVVSKVNWKKLPMDRFMVEGFPGFVSGLNESKAMLYSEKRNYQLLNTNFWPNIIRRGSTHYSKIYNMAFSGRKCIFSVMIGDYDIVNPAPNFVGWDSILITDQDLQDSKGWKVLKIDNPKLSYEKESRRYKVLSHKYLPDYDLVCYMDMNLKLRKSPPDKPAWFTHPKRVSVFQEGDKVVELRKELPEPVRTQMDFYRAEGFRDNYGLYQNGFFVRSHNSTQNKLHEFWWDQIEKYSYRDQLSLPFSIMKTGIKPENILQNRLINQYVVFGDHKNPFVAKKVYDSKVNVHHITPGRADKNLGKAINDIVKLLPDDDWICIRDIDTMVLDQENYFRICEEIASEGKFDLVGCMTNRIGMKDQQYKGVISNDSNIINHMKIATELAKMNGNYVRPINTTVAGIFMLFSKSTWEKVGGFQEGSIKINDKFVDYLFSKSVLDKGMRIGVAQGIYLFHLYRFWSPNPMIETKHLD